jgi:hypothetical protein
MIRQKRGKKAQPDIKAAPPINPKDFGALTDYITDAVRRGPEGLRADQREANKAVRRFALTYSDPQWFIATPWLQRWASGDIITTGNTHHALAKGSHFPRVPSRRGQRESRVRVRAAISWRARWLVNYAMSGSKALACRAAKVSEHTADYHIKNDPHFAEMVEAAKAHFIDLLHTRCAQRALEGDLEPVFWQGVVVGHIRKFDSRLQIEMLRAHMPGKFKTPGTGGVNIDTGDKILVMTEELRAKLIALHREEILAEPIDAP